jgi:hypothetical protein
MKKYSSRGEVQICLCHGATSLPRSEHWPDFSKVASPPHLVEFKYYEVLRALTKVFCVSRRGRAYLIRQLLGEDVAEFVSNLPDLNGCNDPAVLNQTPTDTEFGCLIYRTLTRLQGAGP